MFLNIFITVISSTYLTVHDVYYISNLLYSLCFFWTRLLTYTTIYKYSYKQQSSGSKHQWPND